MTMIVLSEAKEIKISFLDSRVVAHQGLVLHGPALRPLCGVVIGRVDAVLLQRRADRSEFGAQG
jgi:hypothetical protein